MSLIDELLKKKKKLHFSLIDPVSQVPARSGQMAAMCERHGTDAIMVGGSTVKDRNIVFETVAAIKKNCKLPIIAFPN